MRRIKWGVGFAQSQRAQTIIEFAFIMPIICVFLFVIVDFGIALDHRILLQHAVRDGARYGAVNGDVNFVKSQTVAQAQNIIDSSCVYVVYQDVNGDGSNTNVGDAVDVTVNYKYNLFILQPIFSGLLGGGALGQIDMTVTGSSRLEQQVAGPGDSGTPPPCQNQ